MSEEVIEFRTIPWAEVDRGMVLRIWSSDPGGYELIHVLGAPRPTVLGSTDVLIPIQSEHSATAEVICRNGTNGVMVLRDLSDETEGVPNKPGRQWPGIGVGCVLFDSEQRLLMVHRQGSHGANTWTVPGGWVELWEHPYDAAIREMQGETGVIVAPRESLGWTDAQHNDEGVHAITLWIRCEYVSGTAQIMEPDKCQAVEWVPFHDVARKHLFLPMQKWWTEYLNEIMEREGLA